MTHSTTPTYVPDLGKSPDTPVPPSPPGTGTRKPAGRRLRDWLGAFVFTVPALVLFGLLVLVPMGYAFYISFFNWGGFGPISDFRGLGNYTRLLKDPVFLGDLSRGALLIGLSVVLQLPFALAMAVLLNQKLRGRAVYRMLFFAPYILSEVITGVLFGMIFAPGDGLADRVLDEVGLSGLGGDWFAGQHTVLPTLFLVMTWKYFGFHMMLYLAGLQGIPAELHEAARIDGAGDLAAVPPHHAAAARADHPDQRVPVRHLLRPALRPGLGDHHRRSRPRLGDAGDLHGPVRLQALSDGLRERDQRRDVPDQPRLRPRLPAFRAAP